MKKALIAPGGQIVEFADKEFPVHADMTWAEVPDDTTVDDRYEDGEVVKPPPPPEPTPAERIVAIERANPVTHRAQREDHLFARFVDRSLREKINALDAELAALGNRAPAPLPEIPETYGEKVVKRVDDEIKAERAKL